MTPEERAFLRALAGMVRYADSPYITDLMKDTAGALSVSGEAPPKEPRITGAANFGDTTGTAPPKEPPAQDYDPGAPYVHDSIPPEAREEGGRHEPARRNAVHVTRAARTAPAPMHGFMGNMGHPPETPAEAQRSVREKSPAHDLDEALRERHDRMNPPAPETPQRTDLPRNCSGPETRSVEKILAGVSEHRQTAHYADDVREALRLYRSEKEEALTQRREARNLAGELRAQGEQIEALRTTIAKAEAALTRALSLGQVIDGGLWTKMNEAIAALRGGKVERD